MCKTLETPEARRGDSDKDQDGISYQPGFEEQEALEADLKRTEQCEYLAHLNLWSKIHPLKTLIPITYGVIVCKEGKNKSRSDEFQRGGIQFQFQSRRGEKGNPLQITLSHVVSWPQLWLVRALGGAHFPPH